MLDSTRNIALKIILFKLDEFNYALHLSAVERVVLTVEITPLPNAPDIVTGVLNFHGSIIPVINIRKRFNLSERDFHIEDQLIIARTSRRLVAISVDSVTGVLELESGQLVDIDSEFGYAKYLKGIAKVEDKIILIHDLESFLSLDEEKIIDEAIVKSAK
jgi:purine-binding chemotaxis protein CheW